MSALLSSKVVVVEEQPRVRGIPSTLTSVAGAVGVTQRGPIGEPVLVSSFDEFEYHFGGFTTDSDLALAAMGFFENGGNQLWVVRTAHYVDASDASSITALQAAGGIQAVSNMPMPASVTSMPFETVQVADGAFLTVTEGGNAPLDASIMATPAIITDTCAYPTNFMGGEMFSIEIDGQEQTVIFEASDQTADDVAARLNAGLRGVSVSVDMGKVQIRTDEAGNASSLRVMEFGANAVLGFSQMLTTGMGNVAKASAVTPQELVMIFGMAFGPALTAEVGSDGSLTLQTAVIGEMASVQVNMASPLAAQLVFDDALHQGSEGGLITTLLIQGKHPGAYANQIQVEVRPATSGDADAFDLTVIEDGVYREAFANLTLVPTDGRHVETVVNDSRLGSTLITVTDLKAGVIPDVQAVPLMGGDDGLVGLDDYDFIGSDIAKTGLRALDAVQDISLLLVPGQATAAIHNAMVAYCEQERGGFVFAILDPPAEQSATDIIKYVTETAALGGLSEHAAIYWPRLLVLNPAKTVFGSASRVTVPPSGVIAGVYARTDAARPGGIYDPPAGVDKGRMFGVLGFETNEVLEERKRDLVYPKRINPLTTGPGLPRFIDGARTLKGDGNFPYIAERRGVSFIERSLKQGMQFARHKNNTEGLRAQVRRTIVAFLITQMNNGAFRSRQPDKAFFVDVSDALNTPTSIFAGKLIARIGLATNKPAEFIVLRISADTRALDTELAAANG